MKKQTRNYLINLLGTLFFSLLFWVLNQRLYAGIITKLPMLMLNLWFVMSLVNYPKDANEKHGVGFSIFIWVLSALLFFVQKPPITFTEAVSVAEKEGLEKIQQIETRYTENTSLETKTTLVKVYLFKGEIEKEPAYVLVSPLNGQTEIVYVKDKNLEDKK